MSIYLFRTFLQLTVFGVAIWIQGNTANGQPYFQKTYGGAAADEGKSVWITSDGGYVIGGITESFGSGSDDIYIVKLDANGDTMWTKASGTPASEKGYSIQQTADNGYIVGGTNGSMYLNKLDVNGVSTWAKSYGGSFNDEGHSVQETSGNGYILAGFTASYGAGGNDVYLVKTNAAGDITWANTFGGTGDEEGYSLDQTSDGGYIVCGQTNSYGAGNTDVYLLKINSSGSLQWSKTYGGTADDGGRSIAQTADGGYILTGYAESYGSGLKDIYTIKTDSLGTVQWSKTYGGAADDGGRSIVQTLDGGYVLTGSTISYGALTIEAYLLKLDNTGTLEWNAEKKIFGGPNGADIGNSVQQTLDGGYIFAATSSSFGAGGSDIYLVRVNSSGDSSSTCGTGIVIPQVSTPSTLEATASTISNSGGTASSISAIAIGAPTAATKLPLGVLITTTGVTCYGDVDGQAIATASAGIPPYTYNWSVGSSTTSIITGLSPGTFSLTVVDTFGCTQMDSFTINEPGELLISFNVDTIAGCGGGSNGVITGSITGGTGPFSYNWSNGNNLTITSATSHTINGLAAGTYNLTVTDANGCTANDTIKSGMTFTTGGNDANCSTANGSAWVSITGGDTPYTFLWDDPGAQTNDTANGLTPGVYTVFVTDSNGCYDSASVTVNSLFGGPIVTIDSIIDVDCFGANNGEIYMTITDGNFGFPPYTILWSNSATTDDITGLSGGTYTVEVTETNTGCVTSAVAVVTEPSTGLAIAITDSSDITCFGAADGSATLIASGGTTPFTYSWSPTGGNGTVAINLTANTYTATVFDANACSATSTVSLSEPTAIVLATDTIGETCTGGDGQAWVIIGGGVGPFTYLWSDAQVTDTAFNLIAGVYTVTVTDNNGCSDTASATIVQSGNPPMITTDSANNVTCNGGSDGSIYLTVSGGVGPYTYSWSPGLQNTDDITGLSAGPHTVTVIDNAGCTATSIISITEPSSLAIAIVGTNISCSGAGDGTASVTASNGTGPYTYAWSTGGSTSSLTGLGSGFAAVTVTDNCGSSLSDSVNIIDPLGVVISAEVVINITCFGASDGTITITASGGTNPLSYSIDGGSSFTNTTGVFTGLGANTYAVVVRDSNLCQKFGTVLVVNEPPALSIDSETAVDVFGCAGNLNGMITVTASGGNGPISYSIDTINYQTGGIFNGLAAGTYIVSIQDSAGCKLIGSTIIINEPTMVVIDSETLVDISCDGANDGKITIVASGGTGSYFYSIDGGITLANTTGLFTGLAPGSYNIFVIDTVTTDTCVAQGSTFTLTNPPGISIDTETSTDISCSGNADGTISITASGGTAPLSYSIDGGSTFANTTGSFTALGAGTYDIAVQDSNGCTVSGSALTIFEPTSPVTIISDSSSDVTGCANDGNGNITISAGGGTPPLSYSIDGGATFSNTSGIFSGLNAGAYDIVVQDSNGCTANGSSIVISSPPAITVQVQSTDPTKGNCDGTATVLPSGGTGAYTYLWSDPLSQSLSAATDLCGGPYNVTITDANGCDTVVTIELIAPNNDLFIPTAFSPDSDGNNDKFYVRGDLISLNMIIYNRWGEKVFETTDKTKRWDGKLNGTPLPSDSYGYYIEIVLPDGTEQIFKGDILLVR
ncbi:MAG TPA: T9SS type B sorting domain-containing protein [Flavobacteriales bacterium]|nr:T9SS type B sorting domain-containing protein [Flavobacteriales bacterium]